MASVADIRARITGDIDPQFLQRELDRTKSEVFIGNNAAFMAPLMCSMEFLWEEGMGTAATDGVRLWWDPRFFLGLEKPVRKAVLVHELWHPARIHGPRQGKRDPRLWNVACDHRINTDLVADGYDFGEIASWICCDMKYAGWVEEDIYDDLVKNACKVPANYVPDMRPADKETNAQVVNNAVRAVHQAKAAGAPGTIPGDLEDIINTFLKPIIPWEQELSAFMSDLAEEDYTWSRPNRRFQDFYLPSRVRDEGRLEKLFYYEDTSGSISYEDSQRFNSEVKYVWDVFRPMQMDLIQFDTRIVKHDTYREGDEMLGIKVVGRGGTKLSPVREHIIKHQPTAAIIFSDLECAPMEPLPFNIPVIWVAIRNRDIPVKFGRVIHIS
ncbi:DUF2201 family putative metallopeptidase [Roseococcus sp.]|uniref:vWA domain-containing protein n=1 Tax=Roseococcus sp. TaxID=2109646 RepID=UPI003BAAF1FB